MTAQTMVSYYQGNQFNPVPIALDTPSTWEVHFAKRRNLYERHLGIPLALLRGHSVLEFGPNSGENALVLASVGANLTLVEPNDQVLSRLRMLFKQFNLEKRIVDLVLAGIEEFQSGAGYDIVLAEGFLYTLSNRDELLQKICRLLNPGGLGVISFIDRYGSLIELTRRLILWRVYQLASVRDIRSETALVLAKRLYAHDFAQLNASRPFEAWWQDNLVSPFLVTSHLWSYQKLLPLIEQAECEFHASSPQWASIDYFSWYKDIQPTRKRHQRFLENWAKFLLFFLTGVAPSSQQTVPAPAEVIDSISKLIEQISEYTTNLNASIDIISYPTLLDEYFKQSKDQMLRNFNSEMKHLYETIHTSQLELLISTYHKSKYVRSLWGSPYHYLCFSKRLDPNSYYPRNNL